MKREASKTEEEWRKELTPEQYRIMREKGTERAFSGKYLDSKEKGVYRCAACGNALFSSDAKFESGTGWPSFDSLTSAKSVELIPDKSHGMNRVEVRCARCHSHLGHVFDDGHTQTGKRYCINSACLALDKEKQHKDSNAARSTNNHE